MKNKDRKPAQAHEANDQLETVVEFAGGDGSNRELLRDKETGALFVANRKPVQNSEQKLFHRKREVSKRAALEWFCKNDASHPGYTGSITDVLADYLKESRPSL